MGLAASGFQGARVPIARMAGVVDIAGAPDAPTWPRGQGVAVKPARILDLTSLPDVTSPSSPGIGNLADAVQFDPPAIERLVSDSWHRGQRDRSRTYR